MNIVGQASITIERSSDVVWAWVVDPANMHLWVKDVDEPGSWIDGGGAVAGSRYRIDYKYGRKVNEIVFEVKISEPLEKFVVDTVKGPYPIFVHYGFTDVDGGSATELTIDMNARSDSKFTAELFVLTGWFATWFMRRRLRSELSDIKSQIETV